MVSEVGESEVTVNEPKKAIDFTDKKLNLGCQQHHVIGDDWLNVDAVADFHPQLVDDCTSLTTVPDGVIAEIYAGHLLEHLTDPLTALQVWFKKLKPGGLCYVTVPDFEKAVGLWLDGISFIRSGATGLSPLQCFMAVATGFYGYSDYAQQADAAPEMAKYQRHRQGFSRATLKAIMERAGFEVVTEVDYHPAMVAVVDWQICMAGYRIL